MPRPKVSDENRRRVAHACDNCKRRKEKCDGANPCNLCRRRGREPECHYSDGPVRSNRVHKLKGSLDISHEAANTSDAEIAVESLLNLSSSRSSGRTPHSEGNRSNSISQAPVSKLARPLRDGKGQFMYLGDSVNLPFLQNVCRLVKSSIGNCSLTTDHFRHALVENTPATRPHASPEAYSDIKPSLGEAKDLVRHYLLATSGILDLFDPADIMQHLARWVNDASTETDFTSSIYYLVLAIGAQVRPGPGEGHEVAGEAYFNRGRHSVAANFMDDPSVFAVQSHALITMYMLTVCRRNGAFINLGIAVRAAYALGLHRSDISALFEGRERRTRERVWKTLRILDMFLSASLGRPLATSEVDGGNVSWTKPSRDYKDIQSDGRNLSTTLRICFLFERILNEVYCRREVMAHRVESISQQYRDWRVEFPISLKFDGLEQSDDSPNAALQQSIGITHLKTFYYWSIILLTRPFLVIKVSTQLKQKRKGTVVEEPALHSPTQTYADFCVDSAIRSMEVITELLRLPNVPKRMSFLINSIFVAMMVFGVACFGDFDKAFALNDSLERAKALLAYFGTYDPLSRRYHQIALYMHEAAVEYIRQRDQEQVDQRRHDVSHLFGNIITNGGPSKPGHEFLSSPLTPTSQQVAEKQDEQQMPPVTGGGISFYTSRPTSEQTNIMFTQGPSITTSGLLAATSQPVLQPQFYEPTEPMHGSFINIMSPDVSSIPSNSSYADDFPLFSLLTDFDPLISDEYMHIPLES
jgi:hypothetical protein